MLGLGLRLALRVGSRGPHSGAIQYVQDPHMFIRVIYLAVGSALCLTLIVSLGLGSSTDTPRNWFACGAHASMTGPSGIFSEPASSTYEAMVYEQGTTVEARKGSFLKKTSVM